MTKRKSTQRMGRRQEFQLRTIDPMTQNQENFFDGYENDYHMVGIGSAGTGKSFLSIYLALRDVFDSRKKKLVIVRSAVPTRELGHLPGTIDEKIAVYEMPYKAIVNDICSRGDAYDLLKAQGKIEFLSTSFIRGITIDNAVIVVDEFQSMHQEELYTILTRVGENTTVVAIGDTRQCDLNERKEKSCFNWFMEISRKMKNDFRVVKFEHSDIVRSRFVKALIIANET